MAKFSRVDSRTKTITPVSLPERESFSRLAGIKRSGLAKLPGSGQRDGVEGATRVRQPDGRSVAVSGMRVRVGFASPDLLL